MPVLAEILGTFGWIVAFSVAAAVAGVVCWIKWVRPWFKGK